jgi:hypothetical protein
VKYPAYTTRPTIDDLAAFDILSDAFARGDLNPAQALLALDRWREQGDLSANALRSAIDSAQSPELSDLAACMYAAAMPFAASALGIGPAQ